MIDKELRRLKRAELVEIIYELQKQNKEISSKVDSLQQELDDRTIKLSKAGSIAQAAIEVNEVFTAAQAAADQYLASIKSKTVGMQQKIKKTQKQCDELLAKAQLQAARILKSAKKKAAIMIAEAEAEAAKIKGNPKVK